MLFRVSSQEDICIGMIVANRPYPELENLLGCFVNVVPIRTKLSGDMEFEQLVDQVPGRVLEAMEFQSYPFDVLISRLDRGGGAVRRPFLDVIYAHQSGADVHVDISAMRSATEAAALASMDFTFGFAKAERA
jgi:non-ribosomal peptide synthetase component F